MRHRDGGEASPREIDDRLLKIAELERKLAIAIKLYARARKIPIDDAAANVDDALAIERGDG